jgi:LmbE family N-acetylglucosaminyl deacetylase
MDRAAGSLFVRLLLLLARDATPKLPAGRLLVLAPHPDDETIGCGGTISMSLRRGAYVRVVVVTRGDYARTVKDRETVASIRQLELVGATRALGLEIADVIQLGFADGYLARFEEQVRARLAEQITSWGPTVVLVTAAADPHPDHAALGRLARDVLADSSVALFEYMVWGWWEPSRWLRLARRTRRSSPLGASHPLGVVSVTSSDSLKSKRAALSCYASQIGPSASKAGLQSGTGVLEGRFLAHFLRGAELFFPCNAAALRLVGRGNPH